MAVNINVIARKNESSERLIKRFIRQVKKERILEEVREKMRYSPPSVRKREKRKRARRARERENRKYQKTVEKYLGE